MLFSGICSLVSLLVSGIRFFWTPILVVFFGKFIQMATLARCKSSVCLHGKTAIVTGGSSGIGLETVLALASRGCRVVVTVHNADPTETQQKIIDKTHNSNISVKHMDLSSFASIRKFAREVNETETRLDILVNNAGRGGVANTLTEDGLETLLQINYFGPFLLTHLLTGLLKRSAPSRIVFVSTLVAIVPHTLTIDQLDAPKKETCSTLENVMAYFDAKSFSLMACNGFAERLRNSGVTSNSLHPGSVHTKIFMDTATEFGLGRLMSVLWPLYGWLTKTPEEGAQTTVSVAIDDRWKDVTGGHFWECRQVWSPLLQWKKSFRQEVWRRTEEICQLEANEKIRFNLQ